jgi:hypothetical protein
MKKHKLGIYNYLVLSSLLKAGNSIVPRSRVICYLANRFIKPTSINHQIFGERNKRLFIQGAGGLGNQLFQYAAAYALAKKLKRKLLIDDESAYFKKKDSLRKYELHNFNLSSQIVDKKYKFNNYLLDTKRKFLKKIDFLLTKKKFIIESKDRNKKTSFYNIKVCDPNDILFIEGYFESSRYFEETKLDIQNEFLFKSEEMYSSNKYLEIINNNNVVAITIRQHRYSEQKSKLNDILEGKIKSDNFMQNTINYINRAVNFFDKKINNPKYLIWSTSAYKQSGYSYHLQKLSICAKASFNMIMYYAQQLRLYV